MWPLNDDRNPLEILVPKLIEAAQKFDMVPQPQHQGGSPRPFDGTETVLPGDLVPYYLQANRGPAYLTDGIVTRPLATTRESAGKFSIGSIEGSSHHENAALGSRCSFERVSHVFYAVDGETEILFDNASTTIRPYETAFMPEGLPFSIRIVSRYSKVYIFASGDGLMSRLITQGSPYLASMIPETVS